MRILLIDDDVVVLENMKLYLEEDLHAVEVLTYVKDKEVLLSMLARFNPDGVVLDYGIDVSASDVYHWIRSWKATIPIVFYTNYARGGQERRKMLDVGAKEAEIIEKREIHLDLEKIIKSLQHAD